MTTDPSDIGKRTAIGAGWTVLMRFAVRSVGIVSTLILARLLVPADFGLVALAMTLLALLEVMSHFNFEVFLVREPDADRSHYDTAWTLTVLRGIVIAVLLVMMAPLAAGFFNEPRLENVVYAIAALTGLVGFTNIGIVEFQKHLD
ncbi:MAG: oligosaccharide flippase family protein, partial [Rhodospirillaceae bacterium]|nr:oligosaccharide flippase family protein [Rhodospirillaceae bacterium]